MPHVFLKLMPRAQHAWADFWANSTFVHQTGGFRLSWSESPLGVFRQTPGRLCRDGCPSGSFSSGSLPAGSDLLPPTVAHWDLQSSRHLSVPFPRYMSPSCLRCLQFLLLGDQFVPPRRRRQPSDLLDVGGSEVPSPGWSLEAGSTQASWQRLQIPTYI